MERVSLSMNYLRLVHRAGALVVGVFLLVHIANHIAGLTGQRAHIDFMAAARQVYRNPIAEALLMVFLVAQVSSGAVLACQRWRVRDGVVAWLQILSGGYVALFLINHVISVFIGRLMLDLDTDFRFAAAGLHVQSWPWFFAPYYCLAVWALLTHAGCAIYWRLTAFSRTTLAFGLAAVSLSGALLGVLIVLSLAGILYDVDIPARYLATYQIGRG